jgi:hypothetical protein
MDRRIGMDGCVKSPPPPGFDPRTVHLVASRYTDSHIGLPFRRKRAEIMDCFLLMIVHVWWCYCGRKTGCNSFPVYSYVYLFELCAIMSLSYILDRNRMCSIECDVHMQIVDYYSYYVICSLYLRSSWRQFVLCMSNDLCDRSFGIYHCVYLFLLSLCELGIFWIELLVRNDTWKFMFQNRLVIFRIMGPWYVKVVQIFGLLSCSFVVLGFNNLCWVCVLSFVINYFGYPLVSAIWSIFIHSLCVGGWYVVGASYLQLQPPIRT